MKVFLFGLERVFKMLVISLKIIYLIKGCELQMNFFDFLDRKLRGISRGKIWYFSFFDYLYFDFVGNI